MAGIYERTEEMREEARRKSMGNKNLLGFKHSEESKEKMRKSGVGKHSKEKNGRWRGGVVDGGYGYTLVTVSPNYEYPSMICHDNYVLEHRFLMAQHLGRCLTRWEVVHHINGVKDDNRMDNLKLMSLTNHNILHRKLEKERKVKEDSTLRLCLQ